MLQARVFRLAGRLALVGVSALALVLASRLRDLRADYRVLRDRSLLPHRGYSVPTFRAVTLAGDSVTVGEASDSSARQLLLVFNTTCPFCRAVLPAWRDLATEANAHKLEVFGISLHPADTTRQYVAEHGIRYPVVTFPQPKLKRLYRAVAVPQTVVLDWQGMVLYARTGLPDSAAMDSLRAALGLSARRR